MLRKTGYGNRKRAACVHKRPAGMRESAKWVYAMDALRLKSDDGAVPAAPQGGRPGNRRNVDAFSALLSRAGASEWYGPLVRIGCSVAALQTGVITPLGLRDSTEPRMPVDKAAFIVKAALDQDFHAAPVAGQRPTASSRAIGASSVEGCSFSVDVCL